MSDIKTENRQLKIQMEQVQEKLDLLLQARPTSLPPPPMVRLPTRGKRALAHLGDYTTDLFNPPKKTKKVTSKPAKTVSPALASDK